MFHIHYQYTYPTKIGRRGIEIWRHRRDELWTSIREGFLECLHISVKEKDINFHV